MADRCRGLLQLAELPAPPFQRGLEPVGRDPAAELLADLGLGGIERDERVDARLERGAQAGDLGAAVDGIAISGPPS